MRENDDYIFRPEVSPLRIRIVTREVEGQQRIHEDGKVETKALCRWSRHQGKEISKCNILTRHVPQDEAVRTTGQKAIEISSLLPPPPHHHLLHFLYPLDLLLHLLSLILPLCLCLCGH
jgi:hypothetical protein